MIVLNFNPGIFKAYESKVISKLKGILYLYTEQGSYGSLVSIYETPNLDYIRPLQCAANKTLKSRSIAIVLQLTDSTIQNDDNACAHALSRSEIQECSLGYSDFHNLMRFTSKKMPNNILKNVC